LWFLPCADSCACTTSTRLLRRTAHPDDRRASAHLGRGQKQINLSPYQGCSPGGRPIWKGESFVKTSPRSLPMQDLTGSLRNVWQISAQAYKGERNVDVNVTAEISKRINLSELPPFGLRHDGNSVCSSLASIEQPTIGDRGSNI
jgi:hypothetical protein